MILRRNRKRISQVLEDEIMTPQKIKILSHLNSLFIRMAVAVGTTNIMIQLALGYMISTGAMQDKLP